MLRAALSSPAMLPDAHSHSVKAKRTRKLCPNPLLYTKKDMSSKPCYGWCKTAYAQILSNICVFWDCGTVKEYEKLIRVAKAFFVELQPNDAWTTDLGNLFSIELHSSSDNLWAKVVPDTLVTVGLPKSCVITARFFQKTESQTTESHFPKICVQAALGKEPIHKNVCWRTQKRAYSGFFYGNVCLSIFPYIS